MKNVLDNVRFQFSYFYHARHWLVLIIFSIALVIMFSVGQFMQLNLNLADYDNNLRFMNENGISESEALNLPNERQEIDLGNGDILEFEDNPLYFSKISVATTLNSISNLYFFQNILDASIFLIFPLILSIYSINLIGSEYESKMVKIRAIKQDWREVVLAKLLFTFIIVVGFITITAIFSYIVASIQYSFIPDDTILKFEDVTLVDSFNIFITMGIAMMISMVFVCISITLAVLFRKKVIPIIIMFTYLLIVPSLNTWGLKNVLLNIVGNYFPFQGSSVLAGYIPIWLPLGFFYCGALSILMITIMLIFSKKQSKYI